jgi:hypothetical protein
VVHCVPPLSASRLIKELLRGMLHAETIYGPDTMAFKPERFLDAPEMKGPNAAFGFGRR